jgi:predicted dehydrogenase
MKKVAVIGVGTFGAFHAEKYAAMKEVDLTVVDCNRSRAAEVAKKFNCRFIDDYRKAADADYVSIVTPDEDHFKMTKFFLEAGCNVLVEKPMTQNLGDANILLMIAEKYEANLYVGYLERFNSVYVDAQQAGYSIDSINVYRSNGTGYSRPEADVVLDLMIHDLDLVMGLITAPTSRIEAKSLSSTKNGINDAATANVHFLDGKDATFVAERVTGTKMAQFDLINAEEVIRLNLLEKTNDTLNDELVNFINDGCKWYNQGFRAHRLAFEILAHINEM